MEVLQTSALPLGYGAATRSVWLDPRFERSLPPAVATRGTIESNDTVAREQACLTQASSCGPFSSPGRQAQSSRQAERASHVTGEAKCHQQGRGTRRNASSRQRLSTGRSRATTSERDDRFELRPGRSLRPGLALDAPATSLTRRHRRLARAPMNGHRPAQSANVAREHWARVPRRGL